MSTCCQKIDVIFKCLAVGLPTEAASMNMSKKKLSKRRKCIQTVESCCYDNFAEFLKEVLTHYMFECFLMILLWFYINYMTCISCL